MTYVTATDLCRGPHCDITCELDRDCPAGATCELGRCSTRPGGDTEGTGAGDARAGDAPSSGDDRTMGDFVRFGDALIVLDDGAQIFGDARLPMGDSRSGGDTRIDGDALVIGADGERCFDPDADGHCECCTAGLDCDETDPNINASAQEICNLEDDDCNGIVDDGLQTPCGDCQPTVPSNQPWCNSDDSPWSGGSGVDDGDLAGPGSPQDGSSVGLDGTVLEDTDADGYGVVTLASGTVATDFAWAANHGEGTVSRVDTIDNLEVGRYATVLVRDDDPERPYVADYGFSSQCQQPSRTTIDEFGSAYVANRANRHDGFSGNCPNADADPNDFGSVTKIAFLHPQLCDETINPTLGGCPCIDRNGNGRIDTSADYDDPPNGIELPECQGSNCTASCVEDADCPGGHWCIREGYPSQPTGKCSNAQPSVAPCTGSFCETSCARHNECTAAALSTTRDHYCVQGACSSRPQLPEFLGKDDECLLWTRRIPGDEYAGGSWTVLRSKPRAMAIDKQGFIWVGDHEGRRAFKLNADGDFMDPVDDATPVNEICPRTARLVSDRSVVSNPATCLTQRCYHTIRRSCRVNLNVNPYGAVIDSGKTHPENFGYLWFTNTGGQLQRVDTKSGSLSALFDSPNGAYGITIDEEDRVWVADSGMDGTPTVVRFDVTDPLWDPASNSYQPFTPFQASSLCVGADCGDACGSDDSCAPPSLCVGNDGGGATCQVPWNEHDRWRGRGITTELLRDGSARIWAAFNNDWVGQENYLVAFDTDTGAELTEFRKRIDRRLNRTQNTCIGPVGVGIGFGGKVWVVNQSGESMCAFDPNDLSAEMPEVPIGWSPYTYSDFTGNIFRSFTNPKGTYQVLLEACPHPFLLTSWNTLTFDAELPGESVLEIRYKVGDSVPQAIIAAPTGTVRFTGPQTRHLFTAFMIGVPLGRHVIVEYEFFADDDGLAPRLYTMDVARSCDPPE